MDNHFYEIALTFIPQLGYKSQRALYELVPSAKELFSLPKREVQQLFGKRKTDIVEAIVSHSSFRRAEEEMAFVEKKQVRTLFMTDTEFPQRLNHCPDAPTVLYYRGNANLNAPHVVAMVGTRRATDYGKTMAHTVCEQMQGLGVLIVSGLAMGIDAASHRGALDCGLSTVGVVGHGFDHFYPAANKALAREMIDGNGGMLTEFPSQTPVSPGLFPVRNAVIAGMSDCVVVVEAGEKGGALITANIANGYSRDVMAVPGRISDRYSQGCNRLIAYNQAALVNNAKDIYYHMGWDFDGGKKARARQKEIPILSPEETKVYTQLQNSKEGMTIEELVASTAFPLPQMATMLLNMELSGVVKCMPGRRYQLW